MLRCPTRRILCTVRALDVVQRQRLVVPHDLHFQHTLGSRTFQLVGVVDGGASILVTCTVPSLALNPVPGGALNIRSNRATIKTKTRPLFPTAPTVPVKFRCCVHNCGAGLNSHLDVQCLCVLGQLVVEGVSFVDEQPVAAEGPETMISDLQYKGPTLSQRELADVIVGRVNPSSPLSEARQSAASPFDEALNYEASCFFKYGHTPVHVVNARLSSALIEVLATFGIDDELAEFVEKAAHLVQSEEQDAWENLTRRRLTKPQTG